MSNLDNATSLVDQIVIQVFIRDAQARVKAHRRAQQRKAEERREFLLERRAHIKEARK